MNKIVTFDDLTYRPIEKKELDILEIPVLENYANKIMKITAYYYPFNENEIIKGLSVRQQNEMKEGLTISVRIKLKNEYTIVISQEISFGSSVNISMDKLEIKNFQHIIIDPEGNFCSENQYGNSVEEVIESRLKEIEELIN